MNPIKIDKKTIRTLSIMGQRGSFGFGIQELVIHDDRVLALTGDLLITSGLERLKNSNPERVINVGIAEQNMISVAAGLSDIGYVPFATTFSNFASLRANEQIRHFAGVLNCNLKIVGFGAGFAMGMFGTTHYALEDISAIRAIPNLVILSPSDCLMVVKCVEYSLHHNGPMYIRLTGSMNHPIVYKDDASYDVSYPIKHFDGKDIVIFATGILVSNFIAINENLLSLGISITLYDVLMINPLPKDVILKNLDSKIIITAEEHSIFGGLGSTISDILSGVSKHPKLYKIGTPSKYEKAGYYEYMLRSHGLDQDGIFETVKVIAKSEGLI
jgi:transketolase